MCTLIVGQDVIAPGTVILAGNRDESAIRPSHGPGVLLGEPRVVGGSDQIAGGTWMAIRERRAAVAMLNRWPGADPAPLPDGLRSRGRLTLDLAAAGLAARDAAQAALAAARYAPFSAVFAAPSASWLLAHRAVDAPPAFTPIPRGWHVLTHRELDDPDEPRAARLLAMLGAWRPADEPEARARLIELLAMHDPPRACIHEGRMVTVSSFVVWLAPADARYHHLDGRPCERSLEDFTPLLEGAFDGGQS
jgi:uncharacterized protein with NRDE domain